MQLKKFNTRLLILEPTPFCNIDCRYCYLPNRNSKKYMSLDIVSKTLENLVASGLIHDNLIVCWHAGEPLVMPLNFYEQAWSIIASYQNPKLNIVQTIQTNATLLKDVHCELFRHFKIRVGVSIDGPEFIHNSYRVKRNGSGSFTDTMHGINTLQKNDIEFSVISVLTDISLNHPDEMYEFYVKNGVKLVGFNICELEGANSSSLLENTNSSVSRYKNFMQNFFKFAHEERKFSIREFNLLQNFTKNEHHLLLNDQTIPFAIISVDTEGNFSTFSPELLGLESKIYGDFVLGNVYQMPIIDILKTAKFRHIEADITAGIEACEKTCEYFNVCSGGAPANKYYENGTFNSTETMYCRYTKKALTDVYLQFMEEKLGIQS